MDQDLYDIDSEYRKKYDADMQKMAEAKEARRADIQKTKASLRADVLSLSDDDFGSKYGRDRTAKEVATKDANDRAGYKEAEAREAKANAEAKKAGYASAEAEEKALREKAASRTRGGGGGGGIPKSGKHEMLKMKSGGKVKSASARADGCCIRGKTRA
jgi:hypothetical protein